MKIKEDKRKKMVGWYDPAQLLNTGAKTAISTIIGEFADPRTVAAAEHGKFFDYSKELIVKNADFDPVESQKKEQIWIDYVADTGDGWNSTYAVAHSLAQKKIEVEYVKCEKRVGNQVGEVKVVENSETDAGSNNMTLPRGEVLIFGGDGVYPTASTNEYQDRLVMPYKMAFQASEGLPDKTGSVENQTFIDLKSEPHMFVLPGNHDWYDSLVAFRKLFCSHIFNGRKFACHEQLDGAGKIIRSVVGEHARREAISH